MGLVYMAAVLVWGAVLARIDFTEHRLPDRLTLPAIPAAILATNALWPDRLVDSIRAVIIGLAAGAILAVVADLGWGDVKLLGSLAPVAAGSGTVTESIGLICVLGGIHVVIHLLVDGDKSAHIPFGPALLAGFIPSLASAT